MDPLKATWTAATAVIAAASGVAQLLVNGPGRVILVIVGLASLVVLGLRVGTVRRNSQVSSLRADLAEARRHVDQQDTAVRRYRSAMERIIDRPTPTSREDIELTVVVGERSGEDMILERHRTTPDSHVIYRLIRPITASGSKTRPTFRDLELATDVDCTDVGLAILPIAENSNGVLVMILFQPSLRRELEWSIRYRGPHLWDPLRQDGFDRLAWAPGARDGRSTTMTVTELTLHVVFPPTVRSCGMRELHDAGGVPTRAGATGERRVTWRDPAPSTQRYEWELWMSR